jgi:drug/metabolite transporter (DMT)-like permease
MFLLTFLSVILTSAIQAANKSAEYFISPEIMWIFSLLPLVVLSVLIWQKRDVESKETPGTTYWTMLVLGQGLAPSLYFMAMDITSLISQSLVYSLYPIGVIAWLSLSRKEQILGWQWICIVFILAIQVWLILQTTSLGMSTHKGMVLLLGSAVCLIGQKIAYHGIRDRIATKAGQQRLAQHGIVVSAVSACGLLVMNGDLNQIPLFITGETAGSNTLYVSGLIVFVSACYLVNHLTRNYILGTQPFIGSFLALMSTPFFAYLFNQLLFVAFPDQSNMVLVSDLSLLLMLALPSLAFLYITLPNIKALNCKKTALAMATPFLLIGSVNAFGLDPNRCVMEAAGVYPDVIHEVLVVQSKIATFRKVLQTENSYVYIARGAESYFLHNNRPLEITSGVAVEKIPVGETIQLEVLQNDGSEISLRIVAPMGKKNVWRTMDSSGKHYVLKKIDDPQVAERVREVMKEFAGNPWLVDCRVAKSKHNGGKNLYILSPLIEGLTLDRYYGLEAGAENAAYNHTGHAQQIIDDILYILEIQKQMVRKGWINRDFHAQNIVMARDSDDIKIIDYDMVLPLCGNDLVVGTYGTRFPYFDIINLLYPRVFTPEMKNHRKLVDRRIRLSSDESKNEIANAWLQQMLRKAIDGSYSAIGCMRQGTNVAAKDELLAGLAALSRDFTSLKSLLGDGKTTQEHQYMMDVLQDKTTASREQLERYAQFALASNSCGAVKNIVKLSSSPIYAFVVLVPTILDARTDVVLLFTDRHDKQSDKGGMDSFAREILSKTFKSQLLILPLSTEGNNELMEIRLADALETNGVVANR